MQVRVEEVQQALELLELRELLAEFQHTHLPAPEANEQFHKTLQANFRQKALQVHPDRFMHASQGERELAEEKMKQLTAAHDLLQRIELREPPPPPPMRVVHIQVQYYGGASVYASGTTTTGASDWSFGGFPGTGWM